MMKSTSSSSTPMLFTPLSVAKIGAALNKRGVYLSVYCLIIAALWNTHSVLAAPAKLDSIDSTFPLDLQPPIFEASAALQAQENSDTTATTKDSYGNPIESLKPIQTPDGRKVVSAQGLQFEIPNYASGITEIKKPSDDLLPPFIGEFSNDLSVTTTTTTTTTTKVDDKGLDSVHQQQRQPQPPQLQQQLQVFKAAKSGHLSNTLRFKREITNTTTATPTKDLNNQNNYNNNNNSNNNNSLSTTQLPDDNAIFNTNTLNSNVANTTMTLTSETNSPPPTSHIDLTEQKYQFTTPLALPYNVEHSLGLFVNKQTTTIISPLQTPSPLPFSSSLSSSSPIKSKSPLSAHYSPLSNGNFNYPNIPTDESIIERIASKYKNPLPTLDPIVVALPNETPASFITNSGPSASVESTTVDVESVPLVKVRSAANALPDYILELNDPDIGGPVDYMPAEDSRGLKVIAWDLLPPLESEELDKANSNKISITTGHNFNAQASKASSHNLETTSKANVIQNRGSVFYSSTTTTTPRTTTTRRSTTTTTTTPRPTTTPRTTTTTTTPRTTTTRRTTTPRTTTTTTTTTPKPDPSTFYKLEHGDSYTLPTWLQDIDDPDLDVAVAYIVPEDLNQYNHTVERDILPPLEPFTDLNNLHVTPPPTTPRTTTTTKRPTASTLQPHWVRAKPTSAKPTISSFNIQFTSLSPSITSNNFAQRTTSTTTTTVKPKTTTNYYNRHLTNTPQTDKIGSSAESEDVKTVQINTKNPFLQKAFDDGKYRPQNYNGRNTATTTRRPSTTTTTTTTTPSPVEKNPFEPTIPPYLLDFDYADLGPAVPFVYDPNEDENPVDKNILPPSETNEDTNKPAPNSSNSPFSNSQTPQGFTNQFTTSAISLSSSSSIPSIITVPHPSTQQTNQDVLSTATKPPVVFVPPVPTAEGPITTTFNKNFAASFEPNSSSTTSTAATTDKKVPLSADRESFPPFNNVITGSSTLPSKTTFTKSEDGKVITNNIFLSGGLGSTSAKPFGFTTSEKISDAVDKSTTASTVFKQFGTTSSAAAGFVTNSDTSVAFGTKYTGRFGGPPGVLAPQNNAFSTASSTVTKTTLSAQSSATTASTLSGANNYKFTGSFGGPPGILKPFDNVKSG